MNLNKYALIFNLRLNKKYSFSEASKSRCCLSWNHGLQRGFKYPKPVILCQKPVSKITSSRSKSHSPTKNIIKRSVNLGRKFWCLQISQTKPIFLKDFCPSFKMGQTKKKLHFIMVVVVCKI